jgi:hypothetical protein
MAEEFEKYDGHLLPIIPRVDAGNGGEIDFEMINCYPFGDVVVVDDVETAKSSVEIHGESSFLQFPVQCGLPYLVFQIKNLDRFLKILIQVRDNENTLRSFTITNKRTTIQIKDNTCDLPVQLGLGWQYLNLDLEDLMRRCFGTGYAVVHEITVFGSTRIGKIYFQDREFSDAELPGYLRLIPPAE